MPTSFTGLLIFVVFILPGLAFVAAREQRWPGARRSVFRETAAIAAASAGFNAVTAVVFGAVWLSWPDQTLDVDALIGQGVPYARVHYVEVGGWLSGAAAAAVGLGYAAGRWTSRKEPDATKLSAWWLLFDSYPRKIGAEAVFVTCGLDDGSWIEGELATFNNSVEDINDRDLVLFAPIKHAWSKDMEFAEFGAAAVCISAGRIVTMFVQYVSTEDNAGGARGDEPVSASPALVEVQASPQVSAPASEASTSPVSDPR